MTISFLSVLGKFPPHCLIETKPVFEILLKDMAMKSLDRQLKLMTLVMVYIEICARGNVAFYCKATGIGTQILAVARVIVIVVHTVIVI